LLCYRACNSLEMVTIERWESKNEPHECNFDTRTGRAGGSQFGSD
jgi:hypothetical protein